MSRIMRRLAFVTACMALIGTVQADRPNIMLESSDHSVAISAAEQSSRAGIQVSVEVVADTKAFKMLSQADWKEVFRDPGTEDWRKQWTLDGLKAAITNGPLGMDFRAGPIRKEDASHAVLWTRESFKGDIRLDYEYIRLDDAVDAVTILYLQATGSGADGYDRDIAKWAEKRAVPAMGQYFNHMHLLHISYAAFDVGNTDARSDYIRARRYLPESGDGLRNTDLKPDYLRTGFFKQGVPHRITVIKKDGDLFMHVRSPEKELLCHWKTEAFPPIAEGRIGLRHMWTRGARYRDFRISTLEPPAARKP